MSNNKHKAGFVSIIGRPNVGKSTLINSLMKEKLSIITSKAQTTRHRIRGIINGDDYQIVLSDTPGILDPSYKLQEAMMKFIKETLIDSDFLVTPEAKSLNDMRKILMDNFGILKNGSAGNLKAGDLTFKINGPIDLIEKVFEIGKQGTQINRYKGLGEMNPDQLWETTLDKNYRSLLSVKIEELNDANQIFETLMGDLTDGRKHFIQENSLKVANLDI